MTASLVLCGCFSGCTWPFWLLLLFGSSQHSCQHRMYARTNLWNANSFSFEWRCDLPVISLCSAFSSGELTHAKFARMWYCWDVIKLRLATMKLFVPPKFNVLASLNHEVTQSRRQMCMAWHSFDVITLNACQLGMLCRQSAADN